MLAVFGACILKSISNTRPSSPALLLLVVLFAGSGCAALIYELVWFQFLQLIIGSSAVSLAMLLASYMGGMCLGSLAFPRISLFFRHHPLRIYGWLELGIGVFGVLALWGVPYVDQIYIYGAAPGSTEVFLRAVIAAVCLLPPTILMGASLPAAARWVETTPQGISWLGFFYAGNIAGAVLGDLVAGFYLLRVHDVAFATYVAVSINLVVALAAFALARWARETKVSSHPLQDRPFSLSFSPVYVVIGLSGLSALGAEVVWTRLLSLMLGANVYTFSIILAIFLIGLGLGGAFGSVIARQTNRPKAALGYCQFFLAAATAWAAYTIARTMPYLPVDPWMATSPWFNFQVDLMRTTWTILPATMLWGASFPLALAGAAFAGEDGGQLSGEVYAVNTAGAIIGALLFSLVLIPKLGTQNSQRLLIGITGASAAILIGNETRKKKSLAILTSLGLAALLMWTVAEIPWQVVAFGRRVASTLRSFQLYPNAAATVSTHVLYRGDGLNTSIVIADSDKGQRAYYVDGKSQASNAPLDMRLQRMLGHLSALVHPHPQSVFTIGFGAGVTAGSFVVHPTVQRMVICELEPLVPPAATRYFARENYNVLNDRRTKVFYDDARHYLMTTRDTFDVITSDPLDPWIKGTAALYTKEFFESAKSHLNPAGVFGLFVQLYESDEPTVKSEMATFFDVFPSATVWSNYVNGDGYDFVLIGQRDATLINVDELQERLNRPDHSAVANSLREVGFRTAVELLATYAGRASDLQPWLKDADINRDFNLRLEYLAGLGLNSPEYQNIYRHVLAYRRFPDGLFAGSTARIQALQTILK
jgi:spermidine synthase